jgi:amino acid transporter
MQRKISAVGLLLLCLNGTIGSAWLFAPFYAARMAGPHAIWAWVIGGVMTLTIALAFAETSARIPLAGGTMEVTDHTHGGFTAFMISWIAWISNLTMPPIEVQAVLQYATAYIPSLTHQVAGQPSLTVLGFGAAAILMVLLTLLNILSLNTLMRSNSLIFTFKIFTVVLTIFAIIHVQFNTVNFTMAASPFSTSDAWHGILSAVSMAGIAFAFVGFKHAVELAGETINPTFAVPFAIIGSVLVCLILYLGLQFAFIGSIAPTALQQGWAGLSFIGDIGPFAGIATVLGMVWLARILMVDAIVSPLGAGFVYVTSNARLVYALSNKRYFPRIFGTLNKQGLPVKALWFNSAIGMLLFLPLPNWQSMVGFLVSIMVISYAMGPIALLALRRTEHKAKKGFLLPYPQVFGILGFYFCNLISYWTGWSTMSKFSIAVVAGAIVFLIAYLRMNKAARGNMGFHSIVWLVCYFAGLILISYLGSFGGLKIIPFGWDFLVIAIFSLAIYFFAVKAGRAKQLA